MNINSSFGRFIDHIVELPAEQIRKFESLISVKWIKTGEHFIRAGRSAKSIGFVVGGLFRLLLQS